MAAHKRFRILTPDRRLSGGTFVPAAQQPSRIATGCVLMVDEQSGTTLTVHATRLVPLETADVRPVHGIADSVCLKCGRVEGVVEDQVNCLYEGDASCGLQAAH
jgi:hypothetical protein